MSNLSEGRAGPRDAVIASQINLELDSLMAHLQVLQRQAVSPESAGEAAGKAIDRSFSAVRRARALASALLS